MKTEVYRILCCALFLGVAPLAVVQSSQGEFRCLTITALSLVNFENF